jgi:hypothetical protein
MERERKRETEKKRERKRDLKAITLGALNKQLK